MASFIRSLVVSQPSRCRCSWRNRPPGRSHLRLAASHASPTLASPPTPTPLAVTDAYANAAPGSNAGSINDLARQRFNQMITNRVLGNVLLGVNEQVNCNDCVSAFGSAGSFSAGIHGRKNLTPNLSLLAGIAYTQYNEGGYHVTSAPIGAFALRYDFVDWGSSRPFFDIGTILSPFQKVRYARSYTTSLGAVSLESSTSSENYAVYGRAGWMSRLSPRDEVAASVEVWQLWQRVKGYTDPAAAFNPFDASIATGTDRTNLVKVGGQWTHLFGTSVEANINGGWVQSFGTKSGIVATVTGDGTIVPVDRQPGLVRIWRPAWFPDHQGLGRRSLPQWHRRSATGRQYASWRRGVADRVLMECRVGKAERAHHLSAEMSS